MSKVVFSTKLVRTRDTNIVEQRYRCKNHGGGEEKEGWKRYHRFDGRGRSASTGTPVHNTWRSTPHHGSPVGVVGVEAAVVGVAFYHFLKRIRGLCCPHHAPPSSRTMTSTRTLAFAGRNYQPRRETIYIRFEVSREKNTFFSSTFLVAPRHAFLSLFSFSFFFSFKWNCYTRFWES